MRPRLVYVVDDDRAVLESMAFLLESLGYSCDLFSSPAEFLARADQLAPGCLITDLRMPDMTGFELISALRGLSIDWPAFLMTSDNGPLMETQSREHGFAGYLRKPVEVSGLVEALDMAFATFDRSHPGD